MSISPGNTTPGTSSTTKCEDGSAIQRGFQIMGPQGVKTFDQEDRLLLAMSSRAQPLIAALEQISGRHFKTEVANQSGADMLLPLLKEQLRVTKIENVLLSDNAEQELSEFHSKLVSVLTEDSQ